MICKKHNVNYRTECPYCAENAKTKGKDKGKTPLLNSFKVVRKRHYHPEDELEDQPKKE